MLHTRPIQWPLNPKLPIQDRCVSVMALVWADHLTTGLGRRADKSEGPYLDSTALQVPGVPASTLLVAAQPRFESDSSFASMFFSCWNLRSIELVLLADILDSECGQKGHRSSTSKSWNSESQFTAQKQNHGPVNWASLQFEAH